MKRTQALLTAAALLIASTTTSMASEAGSIAPVSLKMTGPGTLDAPTILTVRTALDSTEILKYRNLGNRSCALAAGAKAGASNTAKIVLISVGAAVVVLGVAVLAVTHGGRSAYSGNPSY